MASEKNTPPRGVVIAITILVLLIVFYFVLQAVFPELFQTLPTGESQPVEPVLETNK